jgi:hypothetical protein
VQGVREDGLACNRDKRLWLWLAKSRSRSRRNDDDGDRGLKHGYERTV